MEIPQIPFNESERLKKVKSYQLLDTLPEDAYDNITQLASYICHTPISLVTLLDAKRNFLKSRLGVDLSESPRDISFCGHAILTEEPIFLVEDARLDDRFKNNPLVADLKTIFYAGVPLRTKDGYALGTLCVYDHEPRVLTAEQKKSLIDLGQQVMLLFEAHKQNIELSRSKIELNKRSKRLEDFAGLVAHDLKSPLASMEGLLSLVKTDYPAENDPELGLYVKHLETSAKSMRNYIDDLLKYYKAGDTLKIRENKSLSEIVNAINDIYSNDSAVIKISEDFKFTNIPVVAVQQILSNLIDNAIKYNDKDKTLIIISAHQSQDHYSLSVSDNGKGISSEHQKIIFDIFKTTGELDKYGKRGSGMGLATVKKLVKNLGGTIKVESTLGVGSIFTCTIKR